MYENVFEILDDFSIAEDDFERVDILKRHTNPGLKIWLRGVYDKSIQFHDLDVDNLDWRKYDGPPGNMKLTFSRNVHLIYLFQKDHPKASPNLTNEKRKILLVNILESMDPKESVVFINMLKKKSGVKFLTKKLVKKTFPDLPI